MAEQGSDKKDVSAAPAENKLEATVAAGTTTETKSDDDAAKTEDESKASPPPADASGDTEKPTEATTDKDTEMKDEGEAAAGDAAAAAPSTPAAKNNSRRKSTAASASKTLNKKGSKARLLNIDAKPGDHFLVKLKGFPAWPAVVCDEEMLPEALLKTRPVTAARPDGTYADNYADGGKRVYDRNFPVMYLHTNEFGWVINTALTELSPDKARDSITEKTRKDLKAAFELAAEHHSVDHYKEMLQQFLAEAQAAEEARREAAATPKKSKSGKGKTKGDEEADVEMEDADEAPKSTKSKKRKADADVATPQRSDSVKKPKIKLNTSSTPKATNGTPKTESAAKSTKSKKAAAGEKKEPKEPKESKEAKMTPEERHKRKEKEVLYLRHKLQRGLLTRDQKPQESEMKQMSEFVTILENFVELEVSIIRTTKINKVLKAILKLETIPREEEFKFKERSQSLLDKWNKLMAEDGSAPTNGVNGSDKKDEGDKSKANGVRDGSEASKTEEAKAGSEDKSEKADEPTTDDAGADEKAKPAEETAEPVAAEA